MSESLVTVRSFDLRWEADLCKARLDEEGIRAFVSGDHAASINYFWTNATGGIRVEVPESDAERAMEVLGKKEIKSESSRSLVRLYVVGLGFLILVLFIIMVLLEALGQ